MDPRITHALASMERDCGQCLRVSQIASKEGLSRFRFEHLFLDETGETPKLRSRRLRLKRAQLLLSNHALRIKEVATQSGYTSSSSFSHDFKKFFHVSPSEYRRSTFEQ